MSLPPPSASASAIRLPPRIEHIDGSLGREVRSAIAAAQMSATVEGTSGAAGSVVDAVDERLSQYLFNPESTVIVIGRRVADRRARTR